MTQPTSRRPRGSRRAVALLVAAALASACHGDPPSVLLLSIDTLRADHLGIYGYEGDTSPHIDAYFDAGTAFHNATSSAPCTIPAVRQFLEGAFVRDPERPNLAELMRARGYATAAIVSQQQFHRRPEDYTRGFDLFDVQDRDAVDHHGMSTRTAGEVADRALAWLASRAQGPPFFLWLHFFDPHDPYSAPAEFRRAPPGSDPDRWTDPRAVLLAGRESVPIGACRDMPRDRFDAEAWAHYTEAYDAEIRYVDAQLGRIFALLEDSGLDAKTIVLLLADHGEWLGTDQHWNHCLTVKDPEVRVPFLLRVRGGRFAGEPTVTDPVSTLDALPTLAALAGAALPDGDFDGVDLHPPRPDRVVASFWSGQIAVRDGEWKLIYRNGEPNRLYDTARDPAERWNLIVDQPEVARALSERGQPYVELREAINAEKTERALRRIGYIQ